LQSQAVVQAGQATFNFSSYIQLYIYNQRRLSADGMQIPNLHKALLVRRMLVGKTISALYFSFLLNSFLGKKNYVDTVCWFKQVLLQSLLGLALVGGQC
jgi:hypothetical protein